MSSTSRPSGARAPRVDVLYPIRPNDVAIDADIYPVGPPTPTTEVDEGEWEPAAGEQAAGVEGPLPRVDLPPAVGVDVPLSRVERPPEGAEPDEPEHPAEEARAARPSRDPGAPTQAMRDAHASTHLPFRSWCDECVQGRRDAPPHCRQKRSAGVTLGRIAESVWSPRV